jgi:hypothetical protein
MSLQVDSSEMSKKSFIDHEQALLWELQSVCRHDVYRIARIQTVDEGMRVPDPARLDQTERRSLVRAIFAHNEAVTYAIKSLAICRTPSSKTASVEDRYLAKEIAFELDDKGLIRSTRAKLRFLPNLKFAFHLYSRLRDFEFTLDTGCEGGGKLVASIRVRDRLTHPKSLESLEVKNEEIRDVLTAFFWFDEQLIGLLKAHSNKQDEIIEHLEELVALRAKAHLAPRDQNDP